MTTGNKESMIQFQMRPHNLARKIMTGLLTHVFRDDWEAWNSTAYPHPEGYVSWCDYYDSVFVARLDMVGQAMGWEAPVTDREGRFDRINIERAAQWKKTYHVMRLILLAEITNQIMASERFNHLLDEYGDKLNTDEGANTFKSPEKIG